ncbi:MAG TPA: Do family serine endopeptidase, partial [Polyangiaceae bacterium]|nr:Do family serine endopeptidase [Polyangiaceae bacterium]
PGGRGGSGEQEPRPRQFMAAGSGFIVSADGYVVTNNHVVEDATKVTVVMEDGSEQVAEIVGTDERTDLAVLKIAGEDLPFVTFEEEASRVGDWVVAVGNPFGLGGTVTVGVISGSGRNIGGSNYGDFLQIDAAVNTGNSGGPAFNTKGEVVGVNTAIYSPNGGNVGIAFAIPAGTVKQIVNQLITDGTVTRGYLGVSIQDVDQELAKAMQLPSAQGVLVSDVQANSPAAKGGLVRGDVVVRVDGKAVNTTGQLRNAIAAAGAGKKVKLDVLRDGKPRSISVTLGELPSEPGSRSRPGAPASGSSLDGLSLRDLDGQLRGQLGVPDSVKGGVAVTDVQPGSAAEKAGLRPGDVLLEVDRQPVATVSDFRKLWAKSKGKTLLLVQRQGSTMFLVVQR